MSFRRDYILRMIEMIGDLIAGILGLIKKGQFEKAEESINDAYLEYMKEDSAFFRMIPIEKLTEELLEKHNYTHGHLEMLAELFYVEAELLKAKEQFQQSLPYYQKALKIHQFVMKESGTFSFEKEQKNESLQQQIDELTKQLG